MSSSTLPESTIPLLTSLTSCRQWRQQVRDDRISVGFVATMGALHAGHLSLVRHSKKANDRTVISIFVNPAQFAPHEDLSTYPRTIEQDLRMLEEIGGVDAVFLPGMKDMYPSGIVQDPERQRGTFVEVKGYGSEMEGRSRPLFFRGVATVVTKLFNAVEPTRAYFGQKDIQQALLLRRMCSDLLFSHPEPQNLHIVPTERDGTDNLALSSRNAYLGPEERKVANTLYRALSLAKEGWESGLSKSGCIASARDLVEGIRAETGVEMRLDYIELNDSDSFEVVGDEKTEVDYGTRPVLLSGALWVGRTRLIDNLILGDPALLGILDSHVEGKF
ncbi:Pantoate-beta-alanine ligase [Thelephora terrestris]|uniref:Pantoate--beta-alanine ligase n=1 Tax=Thelephora terrestris TaxID=56493 RepID=A0A9P6H3U3_9AGAM|nr:Pantoate-beta-alanine ligase [Thelephora terrestris]